MNMKQTILLLALLLVMNAAVAFDGEKIRFYNAGQKENSVTIEFNGHTFNPPMETLNDSKIGNPQYARFKAFFKDFHEMNSAGDPDSILSLWHPEERKEIRTRMDDESLRRNKDIAKNTSSMKLKMIIQYGDDYICLVEHSVFANEPFVVKHAVTEYQGKLYLTSTMEKDYFFQIISHYLDKQNYLPLLPK